MRGWQLLMLMSAVYVAPHLSSTMGTVFSTVALITALVVGSVEFIYDRRHA